MRVRIETDQDRNESRQCAKDLCKIAKWTGSASIVSLLLTMISGMTFSSESNLAIILILLTFGLAFLTALLGLAACFFGSD